MLPISSPQNPTIKLIRSLEDKKARREHGLLKEGIGLSAQLSTLVPGQMAAMLNTVAKDRVMKARALALADIYAPFAAVDPAERVAQLAVGLLG